MKHVNRDGAQTGRAGLATVGTVELVQHVAGPENVARAVLATLPHSFVIARTSVNKTSYPKIVYDNRI